MRLDTAIDDIKLKLLPSLAEMGKREYPALLDDSHYLDARILLW